MHTQNITKQNCSMLSIELHHSLFYVGKHLLQIHVFLFICLYSKVKSHFSKITHLNSTYIYVINVVCIYIIWLARGLCIRERPLISQVRNNRITMRLITLLQYRWILAHSSKFKASLSYHCTLIPKRSIKIYHC